MSLINPTGRRRYNSIGSFGVMLAGVRLGWGAKVGGAKVGTGQDSASQRDGGGEHFMTLSSVVASKPIISRGLQVGSLGWGLGRGLGKRFGTWKS